MKICWLLSFLFITLFLKNTLKGYVRYLFGSQILDNLEPKWSWNNCSLLRATASLRILDFWVYFETFSIENSNFSSGCHALLFLRLFQKTSQNGLKVWKFGKTASHWTTIIAQDHFDPKFSKIHAKTRSNFFFFLFFANTIGWFTSEKMSYHILLRLHKISVYILSIHCCIFKLQPP